HPRGATRVAGNRSRGPARFGGTKRTALSRPDGGGRPEGRPVLDPDKIVDALTFDDVLLVPGESEVLPRQVEVASRLTRGLSLKIPLISAAMDTVTESRTAIAMAQQGGLGIVH